MHKAIEKEAINQRNRTKTFLRLKDFLQKNPHFNFLCIPLPLLLASVILEESNNANKILNYFFLKHIFNLFPFSHLLLYVQAELSVCIY